MKAEGSGSLGGTEVENEDGTKTAIPVEGGAADIHKMNNENNSNNKSSIEETKKFMKDMKDMKSNSKDSKPDVITNYNKNKEANMQKTKLLKDVGNAVKLIEKLKVK